MKKKESFNTSITLVAIDKKLDKLHDIVLFPKKLEKANKMLLSAKIPANKHKIA